MCDCFHLAFPNWHAASSGTGAGRRLRGPELGAEDDSTCDEPSQFTEGERPRPQGSSPVEEYPETEKFTDSDKECEAEHDPRHKIGSGKKTKKSGLGSMFEKRSTPKMSKLKEVHSPESGVIVKTAKDGCAEGLVYGGGGKEGIFIKEVVPESPASKSLKLKEGDQILSATVYFDNVSYEDAIQILEHAQAYKVKLCLKRKPDFTVTEAAIESDVIPEEELYAPEMREKEKTKRRGDARISWPKFPSFGKGRKSRFTRSHSSSEADEQRKLELSPTTSDTESPIKSQDALKGKKRHKIKLPVLTKRGRISSSEDQDADTPTTGQISGKILQSHEASDMLSPECPEIPTGETPEVYVTDDMKVVEDLRLKRDDQTLTEPETVQHKVELITIDSTLKTEDLTVALADNKTSTGIKSPDGKKKKKERSELKMKILGKDKLHKKDAKPKSSPKRLKTLGASIEIPDQPEIEKSNVISSVESHTNFQGDQLTLDTQIISAKSVTTQPKVPKVDLDVSEVTFIPKSPQIGDEKLKKGKDIKQKQETTFKLPKIGLSDITTEETVQKMNVNVGECTTKTEQLTIEGKEGKDPYEQLSKSSLYRTQLPKREEIEIPGMEDISIRTSAKRYKEPKTDFTGTFEEIQAETVQLSIDVDSVKEAVSKLPGYKLPKVDMSGVPIPEEITVIDANAQRISVKTPTKVVDTKTKHETHFTKFDVTASPEISKTTIKLPKITPAVLTTEELLTETKVHLKKPDKEDKSKAKQSNKTIKTEISKRDNIIIPGKESALEVAIHQTQDAEKTQGLEVIKSDYEFAATHSPKELDKKSQKTKLTTTSLGITEPNIKIPDFGIDLPKQTISQQKGDTIKVESTAFIQEVKTSKIETKKGKGGGVTSDVKIPEIDGIEYIDSAGSPNISISMPMVKGPKMDISLSRNVTLPDAKVEIKVPDVPEVVKKPEFEIKPLQTDGEHDGQGSRFKMPKLGISMPKLKGSEADISFSKKDGTKPETKAKIKIPEDTDVSVDVKQLESEVEMDVQGGKFKMPKLGITMPKVKGPEVDFSLSNEDKDVMLPEAKKEVKLPAKVEIKGLDFSDAEGSPSKFKMPTFKLPTLGGDASNIGTEMSDKTKAFQPPEIQQQPPEEAITLEVKAPNIDIECQSQDVKTASAELDGKGSKFKMPKFGISMPKVKGPESDLSFSMKDVDVTLPEARLEVKGPDVEHTDLGIKAEVKAPEIALHQQDVDGSPSKFKMPTFKLPKFSVGTPTVSVKVPDSDKDVKIEGADINIPEEGLSINIEAPTVDIEGPSIDMKATGGEQDGKGGKFKMPHLGFSMPKVKGPKIDLSLSKKDVDVTLPEAKADITLPEGDVGKVDVSLPEAKMDVAEATAEVKLPEVPKLDGSLEKAGLVIPQTSAEVEKPEVEIKPLQTEVEVQGSKFKMPRFGITMPKVKGPEIDFSFSKKNVDVTLPEANADVELPDTALDVKTPEYDAEFEGKGSKFKVPKFGVSLPKIQGPETDVGLSKRDVQVKLPEARAEISLPEAPEMEFPEAKIGVKKPGLEIKPLQSEGEPDGQGGKFKMPRLGMSVPKLKGPDIDFSLSKKDAHVSLPDTKADISLPSAELKEPSAKVEIKSPEFEAQLQSTKGSPAKFKMPTFKLPKFGVATPNVSVDVPDKDKEIKIDGADIKIPEEVLTVDIAAPSIDSEGPSIEVKTTKTEHEGKGSKFKMPSLGFSVPQVKHPGIDLSLSMKDVDVTLPEATAEAKAPEVELIDPSAKTEIKAPEIKVAAQGTEGSPSKFKMPTFKLPKFSVGTPTVSVKVPDSDKDVKIEGADINIPEEGLSVNIEAPTVDIEGPSVDMKATGGEQDGKGGKFKMPHLGFSMPKVKGPKIDLSLSKKDVDDAVPEAKADITLPEVELGKVNVSLPEAKMEVPEAKAEVKLPDAPKIDVEGKPPEFEAEMDGHSGKFKIPKFGIKMPTVKGPEFDLSLSKKDVDVKLPETKADITLPEVGLRKLDVSLPEAKIEAPDTKAEVKLPETPKVAVGIKPPECEAEMDGHGGRFKLPKFGIKMPTVKGPEFDLNLSKKDTDMTLPQTSLGKAEVLIPDVQAQVEKPDLEIKTLQSEDEGQGGKFRMPKFGMAMPKLKGPEFHLGFSKKDADITLPDVKADMNLPEVEVKEPSAQIEMKVPEAEVVAKDIDGSPSKFKTPNLNVSMPTIKGPDLHLSLSKKDTDTILPGIKADVKLLGESEIDASLGKTDVVIPEAKIEVKKPEVEIKSLQTDADLEGQGHKFKFPKFGISMPKVKGPEIDFSLSKKDVDVTLPEAKAEAELSDVPKIGMDVEPQECEAEFDGKGSKFKMPKFGMSVPKVKGPDIDFNLSKKEVDLTLPEATADVSLPDIKLKEPSTKVEIKSPEIDAQVQSMKGSPSKFKMPTFKLPKFGAATPNVEVPDIDKEIKIDGADIKIPEEVLTVDIAAPRIDSEGPSIDMKMTGTEHEGKSSKFKIPSFGFSVSQVKQPDIDLSLSKKDVDVTLPEAKAEVKLPDLEAKESPAKVEITAPGTDIQAGNLEGSPSKFKMPTFKLPKFGTSAAQVSVEIPDVDTEIKVEGADLKLPQAKAEVKIPDVEINEPVGSVSSTDGDTKLKKTRFSLPKFSFSKQRTKELGVDASLPDVDVSLPEVNVEVIQPEVDLKSSDGDAALDGQGSKFKLPKFGISMPKVKGPDIDLSLSKKDVDITVPEGKTIDKDIKIDEAKLEVSTEGATMDVKAPSIDTKGLSVDVKGRGSEFEGSGSKFKMPKFGIAMPKVKGPEIDLSSSKKDVDVTIPEVKAEVQLPDVDIQQLPTKVEVKAPQIEAQASNTEGSPSKFKMPSFTLPKFRTAAPKVSVEVPDVDKHITIDAPKVEVSKGGATVDVTVPSIDTGDLSVDVKTKGGELEGSGGKFKIPKFGISMPKVKGPEIDLSSSNKDVNVTLPEAKAEVQSLDAKVEVQPPQIEAQAGNVEGSPSKFKMPSFTLPKFGAATPKVSVEVSDVDKDIKTVGAKVQVPAKGATVDVTAPSIDTEGLSVDVKAQGSVLEGSGSKFKMPKFGIAMPKVKGPEIDLSSSKKDVDVTIPEVKAEVQLPDVDIQQLPTKVEVKAPQIEAQASNTEGSPSKFKMPSFTLPKFRTAAPKVSVEVPDVDKHITIDAPKVEVSKGGATVDVTVPSIDTGDLSVDVKTKGGELEGSGGKFKIPKFGISMPKVKGPEIDLSSSNKDVNVTLPEAKAEVQSLDAKVEVQPPQIEAQAGNVEGSPSKFKMPSFTLPKFGAATPKVSVEVSDVDKDIKTVGAKVQVPAEGATVDVTAPSIDTEGLSVDVKAQGSVLEGSGSKFKMPKFGIAMPKVKGPEIDLSSSKKDVDVTIPEAKAEVQLPDVDIQQLPTKVEVKAPQIEAQASNTEGSPSKFKMPSFTLPKFRTAAPKVSVEVPDVDKHITIDAPKVEVSKGGATVDVTVPSIDTGDLSVDVKTKGGELEGSGGKFKIPKFGISMPKVKGPEIDLSSSNKDVNVTLPEAKAEVQSLDAKVEVQPPQIEAQAGNVEGSPSKFKMPSFTLPKFGAATPKVSVEVPDMDKDIEGTKLHAPTEGATVEVTAPSIDIEGLSVDVQAKESDLGESESKFKIPKFGISMPKVKGPEIDLSSSKKDVDVTLPEAKAEGQLTDVKVKQPEGAISVPDAPTVEVEAKSKRTNWTFPKFSFSRTSGKAPDADVNLETPKVDATSPEAKAEACLPEAEVQGSLGAAELDVNVKKTKFSLPRFSFSKSTAKAPEVSAEPSHVDVSLPEGEVKVKEPVIEVKVPKFEDENDGQESKFRLPKFGITLSKAKEPDDLNVSHKDGEITLPEVKAEVKIHETEVKSTASVGVKASETEAKSKDVEGSPLKFKMPAMKMPNLGGGTYNVTAEATDADKVAATDGAKRQEDVTLSVKGSSVDIKTDVSKAAATDTETPKTETDNVNLGSPSKFKLPSFKMPKLSFSRSRPEGEYVDESEGKEDKLEMEVDPKGESKSPKMTLTSFGEIFKNIDVEFDVPKTDREQENLETSKEVQETDGKPTEPKEKETKQDTTKSPERTGWFKFPRFGLSSPSEPVKVSEKDEVKDEKSPVGEMADEEVSPTCSVQSSDAFADISSAMTSEHVGVSLSSPTKVTVKYSDPNTATALEMQSNIITSTTRTELISVEPNLPEKITLLSSGVSSSSDDTVRLESGKIHVITSNIQATPETQLAKPVTAVQVQSAEGLPLKSDAHETASWTVEDVQGGKRTVFERHLVRETSSERSERKETIVITKQITHMFDSSEPISGETASSIQRLKDSVHSEKMRFFDGAEK